MSPGHSGYDPNVSVSVLDVSETDSEAAGSDSLLHPAGEAYQIANVGCAVGPEVPVGVAAGNLSDLVQISKETANDLQWGLLNCNWISGSLLSLSQPDLTLVTNAPLLGWGGHLGEGEIRRL